MNAATLDDSTFAKIAAGMAAACTQYIERAKAATSSDDKLRITGRVKGYQASMITIDAAIASARADLSGASVCTRTLKIALELFKETTRTAKKQVEEPEPAWMRPLFLGMLEGQADAFRDLAELTRAIESGQY